MAMKPEATGRKQAVASKTTPRKHRKRSAAKTAAKQPKREPSEREAAAIVAAKAAQAAKPLRAHLSLANSTPGVIHVEPEHGDARGGAYVLNDAFGTTSGDFTSHALLQLANITKPKDAQPNEMAINASLALIGAIGPRDELEAALAVQMAATHDLGMEMLRKMRLADYVPSLHEYGNLATKLTRTFAAQMKTLSDWRRGGEQVVRHVHVYEGGRRWSPKQSTSGGTMPDQSSHPMHMSPRCLAMTRKGTACQSPAIRGKKRCRMHGGRSTGAPGNRNSWKHGLRSAAHLALRAQVRVLCDLG